MKKIIYLLITGLFFGLIANAQIMINNGAHIDITSGSSLVIEGDFRNEMDGSVDNSGNILISGDWINNQTSGNLLNGTSGQVVFNGSSVQSIQGTHVTYFNDLLLQNDASLDRATSVSSELILSNTYLALGANDLIMQFGSTI